MHGISTRPLTGLTVVGITVAELFTGVTGVRTRHRVARKWCADLGCHLTDTRRRHDGYRADARKKSDE